MPRVKQFNEEEALAKAMELFWKKGYNATSMQDLVDCLGINRASMYDTFGGKKELFDKALMLYRETNYEAIIRFLNNQPSTKEGLLKFFERSINQSVRDSDAKGCFVVNTATELIPGDEQIHTTLTENNSQYETIFYNYLKKGVERGDISKERDLKSIASFIHALNNGIKVIAKINPDKTKLMATIREGLRILD